MPIEIGDTALVSRKGMTADLLLLVAIATVTAAAHWLSHGVTAVALCVLLVGYLAFLVGMREKKPRLFFHPTYSNLLIVGPMGVAIAVLSTYILPSGTIVRSVAASILLYLLACTVAYDGVILTPRFGKVGRDESPFLYFGMLVLLAAGAIWAIVASGVYGIDYILLAREYLPARPFSIQIP
jgi:hypothetical protein